MSHSVAFAPRYFSCQMPDGTYTIYDVPIFAELPEMERGNELALDKSWMEAVVTRASLRLAEGYVAPMHVRHHGDGVATQPAGNFVPKRVGKITYEGNPTYALFADLVNIPEGIFQQIMSKQLLSRSVEIGDWRKHEISSLALLPDEAPHFKLPMLTVSKPSLMAATFSEHGGVFVMADPEVKVEAIETPVIPAVTEATKEVKLAEAPVEAPKPEVVEEPKAAPSCCSEIKDLVVEALALIKQVRDMCALEVKEPMSPPPPQPKAPEPAEMYTEKAVIESTAKLEAERIALSEARSEIEKATAIKAVVEEAKAKLFGYGLGQATLDKISEIATKYGRDAVLHFCEAFSANVPKRPPTAPQVSSGDADPSELLKFAASDELLNRARRSYADWKLATTKGFVNMSLAKWLDYNVK